MFRKAVVATDLSPGSVKMLSCLPSLREIGVNSLVLVWAVDVREALGLAVSMQQENVAQLEEEADRLREHGFEVDVEAPIGFPPREIIRSAHRNDASLIIIASRGAATLRDRYLGSTVSAVVRMTDVPTMIERIRLVEELEGVSCQVVCHEKFSRVLFATDFSTESEAVLPVLARMVPLAEKIVVMSVVDEGSSETEVREIEDRTAESLKKLKTSLQDQRDIAQTDFVLRSATGIASRHIVRIAEEEDVTLIVMGTRGKGRVEGISLGSTAEATARLARRPVLLVPSGDGENGSGRQSTPTNT